MLLSENCLTTFSNVEINDNIFMMEMSKAKKDSYVMGLLQKETS